MPHLTVAESTPRTAPAAMPAPLELVEKPRCSLCGETLREDKGFAMVSPFLARNVTVCRACHRAALSEGYRPQA
jgi:hypothetical protein